MVGDYHLLPFPDEEHTQRIAELTHLIDRMGPVNLDATREHKEEKERLVYFTEQKADLEKALDDLRRAIVRSATRLRRSPLGARRTRKIALKGLRAAVTEATEALAANDRALERLVINRGHLLDSVRERNSAGSTSLCASSATTTGSPCPTSSTPSASPSSRTSSIAWAR